MAAVNPADDFSREIACIHKGEQYLVRDNGKVLRQPPLGKKPRVHDNKWTFGKPNAKTGYLEISSVRVHRIVATAFHGEPPTKEHVVDHIDTNRHNNRPQNLRWVTRLENVLLNPITAKRIATVCGSVEAFLADPSKFRDQFPEPNYSWMCSVGIEEANTSLQRMLSWAASEHLPTGGGLGIWIYGRSLAYRAEEVKPEEIITTALTPNAAQRNWKTPSVFPLCPSEPTGEPMEAYSKKLMAGSVFCSNNTFSSLVSEYGFSEDRQTLYVLTESTEGDEAIKPWALAAITYENGLYIHATIGTYFTREGADKQFHLVRGLEWNGEDTIDDFC